MGQTPVVKGKRGQSPRHMVIGAASIEGRSYFQWTSSTVKGADIVAFLKTLLRYWPGKLCIVWDNAPVHRCRAVRDLLRRPDVQGRLRLVALPPYAPELNPVEAVWSWLKRCCANRAFRNALALGEWLHHTTRWIKRYRGWVRRILRASPIY